MSTLASYNPLKTVWLPGAEIASPSGVIVIVGPNSSGKTLFLRDIHNYLVTGQPHFTVCEAISPQKPLDYKQFWSDLVERNYVQQLNQPELYRTNLSLLTAQNTPGQQKQAQFNINLLEKAYNDFKDGRLAANNRWFGAIGLTLVAHLTLEQRRLICNRVASFNYRTASPDEPLQGLYLNSEAKTRLAS